MRLINRRGHWDSVYAERGARGVSWYTPRLGVSLELIAAAGLDAGAEILDVGGGASTLVDDLLAAGYPNVSVLDVSPLALSRSRERLGEDAVQVRWLQGDITTTALERASFDLWHDRAVFHFLIDPAERDAYIATLRRGLKPDGQVVLATFAPDGPEKCSGLLVRRHSAEEILEAFGPGFRMAETRRQIHVAPSGAEQRFTWVRLVRGGRA